MPTYLFVSDSAESQYKHIHYDPPEEPADRGRKFSRGAEHSFLQPLLFRREHTSPPWKNYCDKDRRKPQGLIGVTYLAKICIILTPVPFSRQKAVSSFAWNSALGGIDRAAWLIAIPIVSFLRRCAVAMTNSTSTWKAANRIASDHGRT